MQKIYWYLIAYLKKHGLVVLISIISAITFFSLIIPLIALQLNIKKRLYIGLAGSYTLSSLPTPIQQLISSGLTTLQPDGSVSPAVAARWVVEDNGKTYRFIIKEGIAWQDGKTLVPEDINYQFDNVETITSSNDVIFKLPDEYVPFPTIVSSPLLRSEKTPFLFIFSKQKIIGLGAYEVVSFKFQKQQLQRSEHLKELVLDGPTERRIYRFYRTESDALQAFKRGEIDIVTDLSDPQDLQEWPTINISQHLHNERYSAILFNLTNPFFTKNIRQALSYALPKNPNSDIRAIGPINPNSWAYLEGGKTYDYDLERAIERILSTLPQQQLIFTLVTTPNFSQQAENIKTYWEDFGHQAMTLCQESSQVEQKELCDNLQIVVNIKITNFPDTSNFEVMLAGLESPPDPDQYYFWHSEQSTNLINYKNTRIDSLLEKGRQITDIQERKAIYQEFQQFLLEDSPAIFLEHLISYEVKRK